MRADRGILFDCVLAAMLLPAAWSSVAFAASNENPRDLRLDPAPCLAAVSANDDERIVALCSALIDNDKTEKADRLKALIARGAAFERKEMYDSAIADYDAALRLDPALPDILNARGELWRRKGDRPKAIADFSAALKLNPDHPAARANHKSLALELERVSALMAVAGKPSFNCAAARRAVEKAICASPDLADLDREIYGSYVRAVQEAGNPRLSRELRRQQDEFIARRNAQFGKPGYDLRRAMRERLQQINGIDGY